MTTTGCAIFVLLCSLGQWISFHAVELKPYSADTFWALWLPALAVAAATASPTDARRRHTLAMWTLAAAIGHWFSLGALLVLPACFVVLCSVSERRDREGLQRLAVAFTVVIASFALHYLLAIRYTQGSESLQEYWKFAMAPRGRRASPVRCGWLYGQLGPLAQKPGGTVLAVIVLDCRGPRAWRLLPHVCSASPTVLVVLSGFALAGFRLMPLYERLSLWFVPALYLADCDVCRPRRVVAATEASRRTRR